ncbi:MAG: hypothetical protein CSB47_02610 [Proteobacteria bacterium]|nr:MAG: hypothetical protein CSB47_02610 [Pseudomonadota bacterium]
MKKSKRLILLAWAEQSQIDASHLPEAMRLSGVTPSADDWWGFLDTLLLWLGALFIACGVVFFFAYNWDGLGRLTRFAIVEGLLLLALLAVWWLGLERIFGKVALMVAAVLVGVLLALVGQTYQTGADGYELFARWCVLILPWALVTRFAALWMLCLLLLNLAIALYFNVFNRFWGLLIGVEQVLWVLFMINTIALVIWEWMVTGNHQSSQRSARWIIRLLATASGGLITALAIFNILGEVTWGSLVGPSLWLLWVACAYYWYRHIELDVYVLAIGVLSVVAVINTVLGRHLLYVEWDASGLLLMSFSVIALSALGGFWLRGVVREAQT